MWVSVRTPEGEKRRCWRSGFLRLASPLAEEPVPLGVGWLFQDVTESKQVEQEAAQLRFRTHQLHRAARAAAECEDPAEAATVHLDFALAGFADHALIDRIAVIGGEAADGTGDDGDGPVRLVRAAATPSGAPGPSVLAGQAGLPVRYDDGHPAVQCVERSGSVRASAGSYAAEQAQEWAVQRRWPPDSVHALCAVLRSRGRTLGVVTFLREHRAHPVRAHGRHVRGGRRHPDRHGPGPGRAGTAGRPPNPVGHAARDGRSPARGAGNCAPSHEPPATFGTRRSHCHRRPRGAQRS